MQLFTTFNLLPKAVISTIEYISIIKRLKPVTEFN